MSELPSTGWFLLCERTRRWTAALRIALAEQPLERYFSVRTVDHLPQLTALLPCRSPTLLLLEVHADNLADSLAYLVALRPAMAVKAVALIDSSLLSEPEFDGKKRRLAVEMLLREAGAMQVVTSPRSVNATLSLAERHFGRVDRTIAQQLTPTERIWQALPWQQEPWPLV